MYFLIITENLINIVTKTRFFMKCIISAPFLSRYYSYRPQSIQLKNKILLLCSLLCRGQQILFSQLSVCWYLELFIFPPAWPELLSLLKRSPQHDAYILLPSRHYVLCIWRVWGDVSFVANPQKSVTAHSWISTIITTRVSNVNLGYASSWLLKTDRGLLFSPEHHNRLIGL